MINVGRPCTNEPIPSGNMFIRAMKGQPFQLNRSHISQTDRLLFTPWNHILLAGLRILCLVTALNVTTLVKRWQWVTKVLSQQLRGWLGLLPESGTLTIPGVPDVPRCAPSATCRRYSARCHRDEWQVTPVGPTASWTSSEPRPRRRVAFTRCPTRLLKRNLRRITHSRYGRQTFRVTASSCRSFVPYKNALYLPPTVCAEFYGTAGNRPRQMHRAARTSRVTESARRSPLNTSDDVVLHRWADWLISNVQIYRCKTVLSTPRCCWWQRRLPVTCSDVFDGHFVDSSLFCHKQLIKEVAREITNKALLKCTVLLQ